MVMNTTYQNTSIIVYHSRGGRRGSLPVERRALERVRGIEGRGGRRIAPFSCEDVRGGRWPLWEFCVLLWALALENGQKMSTPPLILVLVLKKPCLTALPIGHRPRAQSPDAQIKLWWGSRDKNTIRGRGRTYQQPAEELADLLVSLIVCFKICVLLPPPPLTLQDDYE